MRLMSSHVTYTQEGAGVPASSLLLTDTNKQRGQGLKKNITTLAEVNIERNMYHCSEDKHRLPVATSLVTVLTHVALQRCMHVCVYWEWCV